MYDQISTKELEQIRVSYYKNYTAPSSETITLQQWISANKNNSIVPNIRPIKMIDPKKYEYLKRSHIPSITTTGIFKNPRSNNNLMIPSHIYCIDVDHCDVEETKSILFSLPYVWCAGVSTSGDGVWAFVPINPDGNRSNILRSITKDLSDLGIETDPQVKDIARLRGLGYDENLLVKDGMVDIYYNELEEKRLVSIQPSVAPLKFKPSDGGLLDDDMFCYKAADLAINDFGYTVNGRNKWLGNLATLSTLGSIGLTLALDLSRNSPSFKSDNDVVKNFNDMSRRANGSREYMTTYFRVCKENLGENWVNKIKNM